MDKEYLRKVAAYIAVSAAAIGIIIYIGYHLTMGFISEVETEPVLLDSFVEAVTLDAYIMRREEVLYSATDGTLNYLVRNGEKVAVGDEVVDVYRTANTDLRAEINEINEKIEALTAVQAGAANISASDIAKLDTKVRDALLSARRETLGNKLLSVSAIADNMLAELNKRQLATGETESFEGRIAELETERKLLLAQMSEITETVKSNKSAYYFYAVDGYETSFSYTDIDELSINDYDRILSSANTKITGLEAGKLVLDYKWYAVIPTEASLAEMFTEQTSYDVSFEAEGVSLSMTLHSILAEPTENGRAYLIFTSSSMPDGFEYTRMQSVTVKVNEYAGYRIPQSAVRIVKYDDTEVEGVYILYGNTVYFRRIKPILIQDGYVLCDPYSNAEADDNADDEDSGYVFPIIGQEAEETSADTAPAYESIPYIKHHDLVIITSKNLYDGKIIS